MYAYKYVLISSAQYAYTSTHTYTSLSPPLQIGINAEHSWADAPIVGYLLEYGSAIEWADGTYVDGQASGTVEAGMPSPTRLRWAIPPEVK